MSNVLILLAPSKTMDFTSPLPFKVTVSTPEFNAEASIIAKKLASYSVTRLMKLMSISRPIAESVLDYYKNWSTQEIDKPALWTYRGDVYKGIKANYLLPNEAEWAQEHLVIMSGLYGVVRPYDNIRPYRLEMKANLKVGRAATLNEFWNTRLADAVLQRGSDWICNCCSNEYARPVLKYLPATIHLATPIFMDTKPNGMVGVVPIYSKMMRGVLARWMIAERVSQPSQLQHFTAHDYVYDAQRSQPDRPVFFRKKMIPLKF